MTYLKQTPGAHLIYDVRKHHISVFVLQERSLPGKLGEFFLSAETAVQLGNVESRRASLFRDWRCQVLQTSIVLENCLRPRHRSGTLGVGECGDNHTQRQDAPTRRELLMSLGTLAIGIATVADLLRDLGFASEP